MTAAASLGARERATLAAVMDRLVPPVDDLPGAGALGLAGTVESLAARHPPYGGALRAAMARLAGSDFLESAGPVQDERLRDLERSDTATFAAVLDLVYLAYYGDARVHRRIGWRGGPLQPAGFELAPFDEAVVETVRRRAPFWRRLS
jgi:hypothetical protein